MYYLNKNIKNLNRDYDQNGRTGFLRLDLNENPGGLPDDFVKKVLSDISPQLIAQYPETLHFKEILAKHLETDVEHICLVNGSSEGIRYIIQAFTSESGRIVGVVPTYAMFQVYSEMYGRKFISVPYSTNLTMDVNNIIAELTRDTQLLILLNPNNPMGNVYSEGELERILCCCRKNEITVLIDEAYFYFYPKSFIKYALNERHILVTRTFSKFFSMAGCRLGYVVGDPLEIQMVQKLCTPHNTNAIALKFAEEILETPRMMDYLKKTFNDGRAYLLKSLDGAKYKYKGEAGNFIFIFPKNVPAEQIVSKMKSDKGILIKSYSCIGELGDCLRVTIGEKRIMEIFMNALLDIDK